MGYNFDARKVINVKSYLAETDEGLEKP
jgi:hypothetical protein